MKYIIPVIYLMLSSTMAMATDWEEISSHELVDLLTDDLCEDRFMPFPIGEPSYEEECSDGQDPDWVNNNELVIFPIIHGDDLIESPRLFTEYEISDDCDTPRHAAYPIPKFNLYMNHHDINIESDNNFNGDVWYDYGTWFAQYDWEKQTKLILKRNGGNTAINITVANMGRTGWYGMAWTEQDSVLLEPTLTNPQAVCNVDINTYYMDNLLDDSQYTKFMAVIKHEMGHCFGLAHHWSSREIMHSSSCRYGGESCSVSQDACYAVNHEIY